MTFLLIAILLVVAFPAISRFIGGCLSIMFLDGIGGDRDGVGRCCFEWVARANDFCFWSRRWMELASCSGRLPQAAMLSSNRTDPSRAVAIRRAPGAVTGISFKVGPSTSAK
jgi:hypothetical protein